MATPGIDLKLVQLLFHSHLSSWILAVTVIEPDPTSFLTFEKAYEFAGRNIPNVVYIQHNITTARVSCSTNPGVIFNMEAGDDCDWREPDGLPVNERRMLVDKNSCNLVMMNPTYSQSGTYSCIMTTNKGLSRHTFERNIIVYHVPEYFLRYRVRFLTFSCSIGTLEKLLLELKIIFCPAKPFGCKFQIKITACSSQEQEFWKTLNFNENSKSIVTYEATRHQDPKVQLPMCEVECIRKESITLLMDQDYVDSLLQIKANREIFRDLTGLILLPDLTEERIDGICKEGYFIFQAKVCLPCPQGYYRNKNMSKCEPCGYFHYQPQITSTFCHRCPKLGFSTFKDKKSVLECVPFYMSWQGVVALSSGIILMIVGLKAGCCSWLYGSLMDCFPQRTFADKDARLTKDVVFSPLGTEEPLVKITSAPTATAKGSLKEVEKLISKVPKELRKIEAFTKEDVEFLKEDLKNVNEFRFSSYPQSTGISESYRKKPLEYRRDDEDLPEAIQRRQHSALGWTHKYKRSFHKPSLADVENRRNENYEHLINE